MESGKDNSGGKKKTILLGPWGGNGGIAWDDGLYNGVREITVVYGDCIDSIVVVYDKNGKPVTSEKHGGVGGNRTAEIKLQYPDEFLVSVSGYYCPVVYGGTPVIRSLKFQSNRRTFGPFGVEEGTPFTFTVDGGKLVGLKGKMWLVPRCNWVSCIPCSQGTALPESSEKFPKACQHGLKTSGHQRNRKGCAALI